MQRRDFVRKAALGAAGGGLFAGCGDRDTQQEGAPSVVTRSNVQWRLVSSYGRALDTLFGAPEGLARRVEALTEGRFKIRVYPAGEIVPALEVLGTVQNGTVQMGHSASYYYVGKNPALAFDTCVPFGLTARQQNAWLYYGGGLELMREQFADFNIINLPGGNTGAQMGGWFRREINALSDLRGLKMRIPGLGGEVMSELGATVQVLGGGDIYPALERGAIDATEWVGPYDDEKLGFHRIAKNYYYPGWWEPGPNVSFYVNRTAWDQLPKTYQETLETAAAEANQRMLAQYDARNAEALTRLLEAGVRLRPFPQEMMGAAERITKDLLSTQAADASFNKVYTAFNKWKADAFQWFATAEHSYAAFAFAGACPSGAPADEECAL